MTETALAKTTRGALAPAHAAAVRDYLENSTAPNTRRAYRAAWTAFETWCGDNGHTALPADPVTVAAFLAHRAAQGVALNTIRVGSAAIAKAHEVAGLPSPVNDAGVRQVLRGISRQSAPPAQVAGVRWEQADLLSALAGNGGGAVSGLRDAALIAVMSDAMLRVSELCGPGRRRPRKAEAPNTLTVRRSKTDQTGAGAVSCPFVALRSGGSAAGSRRRGSSSAPCSGA